VLGCPCRRLFSLTILRRPHFLVTPGITLDQPNCCCKPARKNSTRPRCGMQGTNRGSCGDVFQGCPATLMALVAAAGSYETAVQGCSVSVRAFIVLMVPAFRGSCEILCPKISIRVIRTCRPSFVNSPIFSVLPMTVRLTSKHPPCRTHTPISHQIVHLSSPGVRYARYLQHWSFRRPYLNYTHT
jgi:hypothetical protein